MPHGRMSSSFFRTSLASNIQIASGMLGVAFPTLAHACTRSLQECMRALTRGHHGGADHGVAEVDVEHLAPHRDDVDLAPRDVGIDGHDLRGTIWGESIALQKIGLPHADTTDAPCCCTLLFMFEHSSSWDASSAACFSWVAAGLTVVNSMYQCGTCSAHRSACKSAHKAGHIACGRRRVAHQVLIEVVAGQPHRVELHAGPARQACCGHDPRPACTLVSWYSSRQHACTAVRGAATLCRMQTIESATHHERRRKRIQQAGGKGSVLRT